jgi:hypothetical protein
MVPDLPFLSELPGVWAESTKETWKIMLNFNYAEQGTLNEGESQYHISPLQDSLFCKKSEEIRYKQELIQTSWYKVVNCTLPSLSIRIPCPGYVL